MRRLFFVAFWVMGAFAAGAVAAQQAAARDGGEYLPTPFTAQELRAEMVPGWTAVVDRVAAGSAERVHERWTVEAADAEGVTIRFKVDGEGRTGRFAWTVLRDHARFPARAAARRPADEATALGRVRGWLYTIHGEGGAVTEMLFGQELPGPPVRIVEVRDGTRTVVFEQVERSRPGEADADGLVTPAEASGFRETPGLDETLAFLERLAAAWPGIRLERFGTSPQGRPMTAVIVSADGIFDPDEAAARGIPVVLVQNGIHAGEIDGKDACLMLLRDVAEGRLRALARGVVLVIVPVYNVDGHEKVSRFCRANQIGPEAGMGFRTTARGLDLNRDFLKADARETRALLGLVNRWRPALHVDTHVTDGSDHDWVVTTTWVEAPALDPTLDAWVRPRLAAAVAAARAAGYRCGPWVDMEDWNDPTKGFSSLVGEPRYATGYFPLRGIPSILIEMHAYKPYGVRVRALRAFLAALLGEVAADPGGLARASTAAAGREAAAGEPEVVVRWQRDPRPDTVRWPVYDWALAPSLVTGKPYLTFHRGDVREIEVPWFHRLRPALTLPRPSAYAVLPGWLEIAERLASHGVRTEVLGAPRRVEAEAIVVTEPKFAGRPYQGRTRVTSFKVERRRETVELPTGTLWVPAGQPLFEIAVQLFEPEAPDSLLRWGLLSSVFEGKEYMGQATLDRLARDMLRDPEVAAAWKAALEDPAFAADARARYGWWYRRTEYWRIQEIGRLPVVRVLSTNQPRESGGPVSGLPTTVTVTDTATD